MIRVFVGDYYVGYVWLVWVLDGRCFSESAFEDGDVRISAFSGVDEDVWVVSAD